MSGAWLGSVLRVVAVAAVLPSLDACAGDILWNQEVVATIGPKANIVECAPTALGSTTRVSVDRKKILYQYGIVQIDMTVGADVVIHGDVRRTGPTSAKIAFYGRQVDEPITLRSEIASKLTELRTAVEAGCAP